MSYKSDLTDKEWQVIEPIFTRANKGQHFCKHSKRDLVNAVQYIVKTGCQWEFLPNDFPPYKTVNSFYIRAKKAGLWEEMRALLVKLAREKEGRNLEPSYALIDSQSVKTIYASEERGIDGGKKRKVENDTL